MRKVAFPVWTNTFFKKSYNIWAWIYFLGENKEQNINGNNNIVVLIYHNMTIL